jgi:hypothetical protein
MSTTPELTGHALLDHGWVPHKPETWPYRFARLRKPVTMLHLRNSKDVEVPVEAGQTVKIVMVSRFGDVGITEDLTAEYGYGHRCKLEDLYDWRNEL